MTAELLGSSVELGAPENSKTEGSFDVMPTEDFERTAATAALGASAVAGSAGESTSSEAAESPNRAQAGFAKIFVGAEFSQKVGAGSFNSDL